MVRPFTAYFMQNSALYDKVLEVIPDVVKQWQRTVGDQELLGTNNQTTTGNLKASVATSPLGQKLPGNAFGKNGSKK